MPSGLIFALALLVAFIIYPPFMGLFVGLIGVILLRAVIWKILSDFS